MLKVYGDEATLADISVFAYAHVAEQGRINFEKYPNMINWIQRIQALPNFLPMQLDEQ